MDRTLAHPVRRRPRWAFVAGCLLAVALIAAGVTGWRIVSHRPPPPTGDPVAIARFSATPEFDQLTVEQKAPYIDALRANREKLIQAAKAGMLTKEEQTAAMRNSIRAGARVELTRYFSLPPGAQRKAQLDRLIDEQEELRQRHIGSGAAEMKRFIESLPPDERVKMAQFGFDLFQRRMERGLPIWPFDGQAQPAK